MIFEGLIGSAIGGLFRLAPEVMSVLDRKDERRHELAMFDKQLEADRQRNNQELAQITAHGQVTLDAAGMSALVESIKAQGQKTGFAFVDALSASVRPVLTYWWALVLYTAVLGCRFWLLYRTGVPGAEALLVLWGPDEKALVSSIFTFWFLDRVLKKRPI